MRYIGPKNRLARREGVDLGLKTVGSKSHSNLLRRLNIKPGEHALRRTRKPTDFGIQLREKQKLRRIYGITEKQLRNYFKKAARSKGNTAEILMGILERRLDNVIFRLGMAPTRTSARQLVNHGHFSLNKKKVTIPSFLVSEGDVIEARKKTAEIPYVAAVMEKKDIVPPSWLSRSGSAGKVIAPSQEDTIEQIVNLQSVIEFYSR